MKADYFPGGYEADDEMLFIPDVGIVRRQGTDYKTDWSSEALALMGNMDRKRLQKSGLMKTVEVSEDLVKDFRDNARAGGFEHMKMIAIQLLQSAKLGMLK